MREKYTKSFLAKIEDLFSESQYILRYEKGNFKSGYCVLKETNIIVVNKYYTLEGKINCLLELIPTLDIEIERLSGKNAQLLDQIILNREPREFEYLRLLVDGAHWQVLNILSYSLYYYSVIVRGKKS